MKAVTGRKLGKRRYAKISRCDISCTSVEVKGKLMNHEIKDELYRSLVLLGADNGLLGTIASWGDSLPDDDVLANLKNWNEATTAEVKERIVHYETSFLRPIYTQVEDRRSAHSA